MGFYGGRPGQTFSIVKVFDSQEEMDAELQSSTIPGSSTSSMDNYWVNAEVAVNQFVMLATDGSIYIKRWLADTNKYSYEKVGSVGGILPEIKDGYWYVGGAPTGERAVAREIEFQIEYDRELVAYAFVTVTGEEEETKHGLTNLKERYILNELGGGTYDPNEEGDYVLVYEATDNAEFVYDSGYKKELGYYLVEDLLNVVLPEESVFKSNWLQWRFVDEQEWKDLFEITELTNITAYVEEAMRAAQAVEDYYFQSEDLAKQITETKEEVEKTAETLGNRINEAEGYAQTSIENYERTKELIDALIQWDYGETTDKDAIPKGAIIYDEKQDEETSTTTYYYKTVKSSSAEIDPLILQEVIDARAKFPYLKNRLDNMPYQFDTITDMQSSVTLSVDNKVFTFGRDAIGDGDSSKLFQIFEPDDPRLTEEDSEGELIIKEQYSLANGLVAGLLTIFSGTGGGGGGGGAVPSITVTGSEFSVREGETITLEYYWTGPTAGIATLFITDSNRLTPRVVDYYDTSKVYSSGVQINGFGRGTVTLQPARGEHNYTFYVIDRAGAFSNEATVKVICGGVSLSVNLGDGRTFSSSDAITYIYTVNTIYSKPSVLEYTIYQNNAVMRSGTQTSTSSQVGAQSIPLVIKQSTESIGQGEFRIQTRAYVEGDPSTATNYIVRNFVIMETGVIYLTSSYDDEASDEKQNEPFYIPMQLIYVGGPNFQVEGEYSFDENFNWGEGTKLSTVLSIDAADSFSFPITLNNVGTYYFRFKASSTAVEAEGYSRIIKVIVNEAESIYTLQAEDALQVHYSARRGQTNEANRNTWENISTQTTSYNASLVNFNYASNGWETEQRQTDTGIVNVPTGYLHCSANAYVTSTYPFFSSITQTQGGTFEIVFKSIDIGRDQTILSMTYATGAGLTVYKDRIVLNMSTWNINNLTAYYNVNGVTSSDKPVHITITIDPVNRYAKIYVNGVLCRATAEMRYNTISSGTTTYINRGESNQNPNYGIVKVDCVRFYSRVLSPVEVLRNYVYNLRDEVEQAAVFSKNYLDIDSDDAIPSEIPYMTFYISRDDWERMDKDNYKPSIKITYHDPNPPEGNETDYTWEKVKTSWQGTSSIAYPVKNFKLKLSKGDDYYLRGTEKSYKDRTFCLKADYMDSSHCHNTGNANFIHETGLLTNYSLTPAQSEELGVSVAEGYKGLNGISEEKRVAPDDLKTRTCIYGHPIALYIAIKVDGTEDEYEAPMFWGIYNFNFDKGSSKSFGLDREKYNKVTSFEIAANSAYDGGGFRAIRFVKSKTEEKYGWAKWNVTYSAAGTVDMTDGQYLLVYGASQDGRIISGSRAVSFEYNQKQYVGVYNATRGVKGVTVESERFDASGSPQSSGNYIKLWELDEVNNTLALEDGEPILVGIYDYTDGNWSKQVPYDVTFYELKSDWQLFGDNGSTSSREEVPQGAIIVGQHDDTFDYVTLKDPENIDYKYEYYENDFELRYPDTDAYLLPDESMNKLYYKEYDRIIKLVEWVDNVGIDDVFSSEFEQHFDKDTLINYYLMLMTTGLIDNFGKNLMIDTWGYNIDGEVPYEIKEIDGVKYHKVYKYTGVWNEDEEYYESDGDFEYGLMDIDNVQEGEKYNVYQSDKNYETKGELLGAFDFCPIDGDRQLEWIHEIDNSQILWYTHFYDLDSCLGVNNSGQLSFSPSMEMNDIFYINYDGQQVNNAPFNTSDSKLWQQVVTNFNTEIINRFQELRNNRIIDIDTFHKYYYDNIIDKMGERMYNMDSEPKYLSREPIKVVVNGEVTQRYPYSFDHLALGNDWERIESWLTKRLAYLSSMFNKNSVSSSDGFELRIEVPDRPYHIDVECYDPMYMRIVTKNGNSEPFRLVSPNGTASITIPPTGATDQEIYICPGSNVKRFKEMSDPQLGFSAIILDNAPRLLEIDVANSQGLKEFTFSQGAETHTNLIRSINLENCSALGGSIAAQDYPYLEKVNTLGTNLTFTFDDNGGLIQEALLEGNGETLRIQNYSDLQNLTIQLSYPDGAPSSGTLSTAHNCKYNQISLVNCSNAAFNFNVRGRYWQEGTGSGSWTTVSQQMFADQANNYGIFSLFPLVTDLTIRNSMNPVTKNQLQPDGSSTLIVKELQVSLPLLRRLEVVNTQFDKIALVSRSVNIDGRVRVVGYPGWGGVPEITRSSTGYVFTGDSNYVSERSEGIIGDSNIKELEFRGTYPSGESEAESLPLAGVFQFPWRMYLGTLTGLERLKFNTTSVTPKRIHRDTTGINGDPNYLTKNTSTGLDSNSEWLPASFELILPEPTEDGTGLKMIYFSPSVQNVEFTAIRQVDTNIGEYVIENNSANIAPPYNWPSNYFEAIQVGQTDTAIGQVYLHPFRGIDLRGYRNLSMNFRGLSRIKGIVGMNALSITGIKRDFGNNIFENFFRGCATLATFHSTAKESDKVPASNRPAIYTYTKWDFSDWFSQTNGSNFDSLNYFFSGCTSLKDTSYIRGLTHWSNTGFNVKTAQGLFYGCTGLEDIEIDWANLNSTIYQIDQMFKDCTGLINASVQIGGTDVAKPHITDLSQLFSDCMKLQSARVILMTDDQPTKSALRNIKNMSRMFYNCQALQSFDFTLDFNSLDIDAEDTYVYTFENINNVSSMFEGCSTLTSVKFLPNMDWTQLTTAEGLFRNCELLEDVFSEDVLLYDAEKSTANLDFGNMFNGCRALRSIQKLKDANVTRLVGMNSMFYGCAALGGTNSYEPDVPNGSLDLSHWTFDPERTLSCLNMFFGCSQLTKLQLPQMKIGTIQGMFSGCQYLNSLDLSSITLDNVTSLANLFSECNSLTTDGLIGYEDWNISNVYNFESMFSNCRQLTELDLTNWHSYTKVNTSNITCASMFSGCTNLANIKGLCSLFGLESDIKSGNRQSMATTPMANGGMTSTFSNCQALKFGIDDNYISPWAFVGRSISNFRETFMNCRQLTDLGTVLRNPSTPSSTSNGVFWGGNTTIMFTETDIRNQNCAFWRLNDFENMCAGCTNLQRFDYFDASKVGYTTSTDERYTNKYPSSLAGTCSGCTNLTVFAFGLRGMQGLHKLTKPLTLTFSGCTNLNQITFPDRSSSTVDTQNNGIQRNINVASAFQKNLLNFSTFILTFDQSLYDFVTHGRNLTDEDRNNFGVLTVSQSQYNEALKPEDSATQKITALGWTIVTEA